ncbi:MotB family protein [Chelativorans sp. M5D2P16]|uniref:MotB family protein n=1 Tax=Chelativorans sp. M5D2P16 TaxID=3095678 RepID=UPI002ACAE51D|nr:MotB family protein [Chelativorans sp. M5D2P16]MDZ5698453.1 MotB family protein [Chelativorans sp. M5D2P16]
MTMADGGERQPEIIIVRRGGDDEDEGHHGGVWKIAFADFMTAMMCFFLVMWLINAANEQTRSALASYFNPVKLIDRSTSSKGLEDMGLAPQNHATRPQHVGDPEGTPTGERDQTPGGAGEETGRVSDENFFSDPYAVLAEIAAETGMDQNVSPKGEGGEQDAGPSSGASGGEAYRDPFAPDFWSQQVSEPRTGVEGDPDEARENPFGGDARAEETGEERLSRAEEREPSAAAQSAGGEPARAPALESVAEAQPLAPAEESARPDQAEPAKKERQEEAAVRERAADAVRTSLARALEGEGLAASVTVEAGQDGVLISVMDDVRNGMFPVGSAVPARPLVTAMEKIGRVLAQRPGLVRVHGHTDARPYSDGNYDNWRLSTARAHAAQYMLVRGGLDEARLEEVAGFADRHLKRPDDPLAAANRRIEILLEMPR